MHLTINKLNNETKNLEFFKIFLAFKIVFCSIFAFIKKQKMLNRKTVSLLVTLFFFVSIVSPTISMIIGNGDERVCIIDSSDLESKEKEPTKDKENKIIDASATHLSLIDYKSLVLGEYYLHSYTMPPLNLVSPPPEHLS